MSHPIRDPGGKVLGHYTPLVSPETAAMYEKCKELFNIEEAERTLAAERGQGHTLKEVMDHIRSLDRQG